LLHGGLEYNNSVHNWILVYEHRMWATKLMCHPRMISGEGEDREPGWDTAEEERDFQDTEDDLVSNRR
jgi:hypothetical protein